jgi:hypothetical protein
VPIAQEPRGEPRADVSGDAGDEDVHRRNMTTARFRGPGVVGLASWAGLAAGRLRKAPENAGGSWAVTKNSRCLQGNT